MKCKQCSNKATKVINSFINGKVRYAFRCELHLDDKLDLMRSNDIKGSYGDICPFCLGTGKIARFNHVSHGVCFRCSGSGIFGKHINIESTKES